MKAIPRNWVWTTKGAYPTRPDCYRALRANPIVETLKEEDLEFGSDVRPFGSDRSLLWNGNGVILDGPLSQWWSCQPENRKPKRGSYPFEQRSLTGRLRHGGPARAEGEVATPGSVPLQSYLLCVGQRA